MNHSKDYRIVMPEKTQRKIVFYNWKALLDTVVWTGESGCSATFIRNGAESSNPEQFGVKFFPYLWEAVCSWMRQDAAAKMDAAPPVGKLVFIRKNGTVKMWGYETGVASRIDAYQTSDAEFRKLEKKLMKVNIDMIPRNDLFTDSLCTPRNIFSNIKHHLGGDLHSENLGRWCGKLVCIDFGVHCVVNEDEEIIFNRPDLDGGGW